MSDRIDVIREDIASYTSSVIKNVVSLSSSGLEEESNTACAIGITGIKRIIRMATKELVRLEELEDHMCNYDVETDYHCVVCGRDGRG